MSLSAEQRAALERLYENETLTSNLTDASAAAVLKWAEEQLNANAPEEKVLAALRHVNDAALTDPQQAVAAAQLFLAGVMKASDAVVLHRSDLEAGAPLLPPVPPSVNLDITCNAPPTPQNSSNDEQP
ncbi:MAG: hypothetical protein ONB06_08485 [candidate division KSB1 bacterium]|nr:hypothetical protein [candidate division KSB1 bacterium]